MSAGEPSAVGGVGPDSPAPYRSTRVARSCGASRASPIDTSSGGPGSVGRRAKPGETGGVGQERASASRSPTRGRRRHLVAAAPSPPGYLGPPLAGQPAQTAGAPRSARPCSRSRASTRSPVSRYADPSSPAAASATNSLERPAAHAGSPRARTRRTARCGVEPVGVARRVERGSPSGRPRWSPGAPSPARRRPASPAGSRAPCMTTAPAATIEPGADVRAVHTMLPMPDQHVVVDPGAVQHHVVADGDPAADDQREARVAVQRASRPARWSPRRSR